MDSSTSYLKRLKAVFMIGYLLFSASISRADLQATQISPFSVEINDLSHPYTEILHFCVYDDDPDGKSEYKVNVCSPNYANDFFSSTDFEQPLKYKLYWKGENKSYVELYPCALSSETFKASKEFNCSGKEEVELKMLIESSSIQDAAAGPHRLPLSISLHPA